MGDSDSLTRSLEAAFLASAEGRREIPFFAQLPDSAVSAALGCYWETARLFALADTLPVEHVSVDTFRWVMDVKWRADGESMNEARARGPASPTWRRAMAADLRYPIVLAPRPDRWTVLDGYHRLLKADVEACEMVSAVRLPRERLPEILTDAGFFGALNQIWRRGHEIIHEPARTVARSLLARGLAG